MSRRAVRFADLGNVTYREAWDLQEAIFTKVVDRKTSNRKLPEDERIPTEDTLLFVEHPHVYTLGKSGDLDNLLADGERLKAINAEFFRTNRGGDITFHGEGQIVGYPILDLDQIYTDIHRYLRDLEEIIILTLNDFGISNAGRKEGLTGVWVENQKLCAIGVRTSRWVTMHGFALNVNTDLRFFDFIVPCGIRDKAVGSMQGILGRELDLQEVKARLLERFCEIFSFNSINAG